MSDKIPRNYEAFLGSLIRATRVVYKTSPKNPESAHPIMSNQIVWLTCQMQPGMFSDEFAVQIHLSTGAAVSLFAHKTLVKQNGSATSGYLSTTFIKRIAPDDGTVLLPSESFETGNRLATVRMKDLHPA